MSKTLVILLIFSSTLLVTYTAGQVNPPQTCKAEEEWKKKNGQDGCFCVDAYSVTILKDVTPDLTCELFEMVAIFHKCQFKDLNFNFNADSVPDKICYDIIDDDKTNTITIKAPINEGSCAFQSQETSDTKVTYISNFLIAVTEPGSTVIRKDKLNVTLKCSYDLDMITSLHKILKPIISAVDISVGKNGTFTIYMSLYKKSDYKDPYSESEVSVNTEDFLYVGVFVYGGDHSTLLLVMKNCYATPSNNVNDPVKYYIIKDRCPDKSDGTITVVENGISRQGKFSVQMFKFAGEYDYVYLHCAASLCDKRNGSCIPNCNTRGSRSDGTGNAQIYDALDTMTIGPIKQTRKSGSSAITSSHILWTLLIPALAILI